MAADGVARASNFDFAGRGQACFDLLLAGVRLAALARPGCLNSGRALLSAAAGGRDSLWLAYGGIPLGLRARLLPVSETVLLLLVPILHLLSSDSSNGDGSKG